MTVHKSKQFRKLDKSLQEQINKAISKLNNRYREYRKQNIVITKLFGDDVIIHDIIDDDLYVYKCRTKDVQIRLLYTVDNKDNINVLDFAIKNHDNMKTGVGRENNRYIDMFKNNISKYKAERSLA
jgi:hypothetical protein